MSDSENSNIENKSDDRSKVISGKIEKLKLKLLDLTRRNPLISVSLKDKHGSNIRVVDEVLNFLFDKLQSGKMKIVPLPALEEELKDEKTREFHDALSEALISEELYLGEIDKIDEENEKAPDLLAKAERSLKDRIRAKLKMPVRQMKANLSIQQHAINHGINPHYDLSVEGEEHKDGRHSDDNIQTLLLPDALERKLNALSLKDRTWKEEVGINVLYAGFGFVEWKQSKESEKTFHSPLILLPIELEKKRGRSGQEFWISAEDATPEWNMTLSEKLRIDYGIELPKYEVGDSIEEYFTKIESQKPKGMDWKFKRLVVLGVFPSAKLSMYYDLDESSEWNFADNQIISSLFGGSSDVDREVSIFGDEYNIDDPFIENKVPLVVTDVDSSQFSTIVDVMDGKNLAVEGPPGTGKSQTIVNTIAANLAQGKKVMFVAEKSAALEVVRSRLEKFGLGHFLLPLQAARSSKEQIISSIRDRIEARFPTSPQELEGLKNSFKKTRDELGIYIQTLSSEFGGSGKNVHQILGNAISLRSDINSLPKELQGYSVPMAKNISQVERGEVEVLLRAVEDAWLEAQQCNNWWKDIKRTNIDPFSADEILGLADDISKTYQNSVNVRSQLKEFEADVNIKNSCVNKLKLLTESLPTDLEEFEINIIESLDSSSHLEKVESFLNEASDLRSRENDLSESLSDVFKEGLSSQIREMADLIKKNSMSGIDIATLDQAISDKELRLSNLKESISIFCEVERVLENSFQISAKYIIDAARIINNTSREAILIRADNLSDPVVKVLIEKGQKKVKSLLEQRESLDEKILLAQKIKREDVLSNMRDLKESGLFGIFSSKYRQAKSFYKDISRGEDKFNKSKACLILQELESWLSAVEELESDDRLKEVLGVRFDGLETKFEPYLELFEYLSNVDQSLSNISCLPLKNLLKLEKNNDLLFSFPKISDDHPINLFPDINLESAKELISEVEQELDVTKRDVGSIDRLAGNLLNRDIWDSDKLYELSDKVSLLQDEWVKLSNRGDIEALLGPVFNGARTEHKNLKRSLSMASQIISSEQKSSIINSIRKGKLKEFLSILDSIILADLKAWDELKKLSEVTNTSPDKWCIDKNCSQISEYMSNASRDKSGLIAFSNLVGAVEDLKAKGYGEFIDNVFKAYTPPCNIIKIFKAVLARSTSQEIYKQYGQILTKFNGIKLSSLRKQLADLDVKIIELSRQYLQSKLDKEARPPSGTRGNGRKSEYTNMELLRNEISKSRRHIPMREITKRAGDALIELKPCWMMSPLAVANYIPKDTIEFDLLIIDEASQMTPENSIGALLRAKQVMVVGDVNQLPPSNFFGKIFDDEEEDKDEIVTEASILEMASSIFSPKRRLKWHYRSRNSGLISFSNRYIYDNDLVVFPSANEGNPEMGVSYKKVEGIYSTGVNPEEAKAMVDAIVDFMSKYPNKSLGVVVMNKKQATLLTEEMDYAFEKNPVAMNYKEKWRDDLECFFIKNIENVQGDERDVIFIGTVYGPEKVGSPVKQRFGPINGAAGRRRLNVLFSRAKERIVTFSSMNASDIKAEEDTGNQGAHMLKQWLEYCATGRIHGGVITNKETDSGFEDHVIQQIRSIGCDAIPQVGVVGFSIDIGVKHPDWPHGFIMGVECDGATYHSSKSARDRDRLRQEVLEGLGWNLYRIWSTDWFDDPIRETEKLREAIALRIKYLKSDE